jgi:hypothetical protein
MALVTVRQACRQNLNAGIFPAAAPGNVWYADSEVEAAGNGTTWKTAFDTITAAVAKASAGDTIAMKGSFNEAVTCDTHGIHFVGVGNSPKECIWTAPTVAASFCLKPTGENITVENIYFRAVIYTGSGVPSAIRLSGSNWFKAKDCIFRGQTGSYTAIYSPVCDSDNVILENCQFAYFNTATNGIAILGVEAGGLSYSGWKIIDCDFLSNLKHIDVNMRSGVIKGCSFPVGGIIPAGSITDAFTTMCIDLSGTSSGANVVTQNTLGGAYTTALYVSGAGLDNWKGNFTNAQATTAAYGLSVAVPAS